MKRNNFAKRLLKLWVGSSSDEDANLALIDAFLEFGSESRDNLKCAENIEYGVCERNRGPANVKGLKIKDHDVLVSDIVWYLEDERVYEFLAKQFPDLNIDQIEAALRMTTMVLSSFDKDEDE